MDITIPNFFLENKHLYDCISTTDIYCISSRIHKKEKLLLRITTHMLIIVQKGKKLLHLDKNDISINDTQMIFLAQGNYFLSEIMSEDNEFETIIICFDDKFVNNFLSTFSLSIDINRKKDITIINKDAILNKCIDTLEEYFNPSFENNQILIRHKVLEIFLYLFLSKKQDFILFLKTIIDTNSSRLKYILESNIDIINSVEDIYKLTKLSEKSLRKEIKRLYNSTPKKWLDSYRIYKAKELLKNTDNTISDISTSCGYSSVSWFISQFKKYNKTTPNKYREENLYL